MPALLAEGVFREQGIKNGVQVNVDQVVKIPQVCAGHGIACLVRKGEGIEKGLQRTLEKLRERLFYGIFF